MRSRNRLSTVLFVVTIVLLAQIAIPGPALAATPIPPGGQQFVRLMYRVVDITAQPYVRNTQWVQYALGQVNAPGKFIKGLPWREGSKWFARVAWYAEAGSSAVKIWGYTPLITEEQACSVWKGWPIKQVPARCQRYMWQ